MIVCNVWKPTLAFFYFLCYHLPVTKKEIRLSKGGLTMQKSRTIQNRTKNSMIKGMAVLVYDK